VIGEDHLKQIEKLLEGRKVIRYTEAESHLSTLTSQLSSSDVLIINCFGLLSSIYRYGDVTYVGGGFGVGIHNTLEAAVWDVPVFFGPNNQKFQEAQKLKACGGGLEISSYEDFERQMNLFDADAQKITSAGQEAGKLVQQLAGATQKVLSGVQIK
jgi:3-deoxy-D-manno-octulosonic-acid transferase